ncbi:hypothetical protein BGO17_00645 [Candidatus Saccharibacteria bacterium 49-20]|nr:MAG: hypothetical protein BGO17_00645 [Candidatus Saccharibacteria bacterium 49-20]
MNQDTLDSSKKKNVKKILGLVIGLLLIVLAAAAVGFFVTMSVVNTAHTTEVKDELITQNSRLRQSAVDGVLTDDAISRTKSTNKVQIALKVARDGKTYCIEAQSKSDPEATRYHMESDTPELEPVGGLCGENATKKPGTPTEFVLGSSGTTTISFSWSEIPNARSYTLTCKDASGAAQTKTSFKAIATIEGLKSSTQYECRVIAKNSQGESDASKAETASTKILLAVPTSVKLTSRNASTLTYTWAATSGVKYYVFEYATDDNFTKDVKRVTVTSPQITLTGLKADTAFFVHVKAVTQIASEQQAPYSEVVQGRTEK